MNEVSSMELFLIGLATGLFFFLLVLIQNIRMKRRHKREMLQIKNMISQKMDMEYESLAQ